MWCAGVCIQTQVYVSVCEHMWCVCTYVRTHAQVQMRACTLGVSLISQCALMWRVLHLRLRQSGALLTPASHLGRLEGGHAHNHIVNVLENSFKLVKRIRLHGERLLLLECVRVSTTGRGRGSCGIGGSERGSST